MVVRSRRLVVLVMATALVASLWGPAAAAQGATAQVSVHWGVLNIRGGPGTGHPVLDTRPAGAALAIACQVSGEHIAGRERATATWNRLTDGTYVTDAYVAWSAGHADVPWCDGGASVRTDGSPLNIRGNASTTRAPLGRLPPGAEVAPVCQISGERFAGTARTTSAWLRLDDGRYVSDAYVAWQSSRPDLPWCEQPQDPAPSDQRAFVRWAAEYASDVQREYGVPASVTIAQAINESGWGRSSLTAEGNAYFGTKCFGTPGPVAAGCRPYATFECEGANCFPTTATIRVYRAAADSFSDHGRFLTVNPRYGDAFAHTGDPDRFAREIHRAGYATDPVYADKLIALMRQFDLYRFDR